MAHKQGVVVVTRTDVLTTLRENVYKNVEEICEDLADEKRVPAEMISFAVIGRHLESLAADRNLVETNGTGAWKIRPLR